MLNYIVKIINNLVISAIVLGTIIAVAGIGVISYYGETLPDYRQLTEYNPSTVTRIYAADGKLIEEYATEHRLFVPISAIPKRLINAFLAAEDKNFYQHSGVDFNSLFRAVIQNVMNYVKNKSLVGGSTITQQVVKNFLLTNERSLTRKIKEAILSFRISQVYTKDRILELYLNQIYLGNGSYGVASAAINYFNKSIDDLSIEEEALIAALPKAPSLFDPKKNPNRVKQRRDYVIERMMEEGFIGKDEAYRAMLTNIVLHNRNQTEFIKADFFAEAVRKELAAKYGSKALYEQGLVVHATLDPQIQKMAEKSFRDGLFKYEMRRGYRGPIGHTSIVGNWRENLFNSCKDLHLNPYQPAIILKTNSNYITVGLLNDKQLNIDLGDFKWIKPEATTSEEIFKIGDVIVVEQNDKIYSVRQIPQVSGGMIAIEPNTGKILAVVGGFNFENSEFNRALQAKRQPGSVFKTFIYLSALEHGYNPTSLILDGPIELSQGAGLPMWKPKNYSGDFLGLTTLRRGLEKSRNTMTVRLAESVGLNNIIELTKRLSITSNPQRNLSLALGADETTLVDITNAYAMLANGGKKVEPALIDRIQDRNGKTIYKRQDIYCKGCHVNSLTDINALLVPEIEDNRPQIIDPAIAYQMVSLLEGAVQRGTARQAKVLEKTIAGKTGTTNDSNDAWFIGFTQDLVVGTYIGYDQPRSLGKKETGATVALPIFIDFMKQYLLDKPDLPFRIPKNVNMVKVNATTGQPTSEPIGGDVIYEAFKDRQESNEDSINYQENNSGTGGFY